MEEKEKKPPRLASLDALRGFDMFFIMGGAGLISGLCSAFGADGGFWLARQMHHVAWAGLAQHDTIFPLFLFLAGVSWPFSLAAQRARGRTPLQIHLKLFRRVALLFLLGLFFGGILKWSPTFRMMSVLGFIGLSWGVAALVYYHVEKPWLRWTIFGAIAVGYFSLLHFGAFPGAPAGADTYCKEWNIVRWLDTSVYPEHMMIAVSRAKPGTIPYEPESLFSIPGGILVALMGMFAGTLLRSELRPGRKALALLGAAVAALAVDLVLVFVIKVPIVKALWTVSFSFAAAAYSFALLSLFYFIVDVLGWKKWTVVFDPVGKNSILVYTLSMIGVTAALRAFFFEGTIAKFADWGCKNWKWAATGLATYLVTWGIARLCQKHNMFLKV